MAEQLEQLTDRAASALPEVTTHDPGALRILQLLKESPPLTAALTALTAAVLNPSPSDDSKALAAISELTEQTRKLSTEIGSVHCETKSGRSGQRLALVSLRLGEQACGYFHAGLAASDSAKIKAELAEAASYAQAAQSNGTHAIKLLSK